MISYDEALACLAANLAPAPSQRVDLGVGVTGSLSRPVHSTLDIPDFDNAAMDGIAIRSCDVAECNGDKPATLRITGSIAAGQSPGAALQAGEAMEIMTGAPIPVGADAVIPVERIEIKTARDQSRQARITTSPESGANIRRAGADVRRGDLLLPAGVSLTPEAIMNLSAAGVDTVELRSAPKVALVTTGRELSTSGAPTGTGMIRDANGPYLAAALSAMGAEFAGRASATDELSSIVAAVGAIAADARVILTTGGVSAGRFDCVPAAVEALGGEILFHKVAIRPGKPVLFARLPNHRWLFGLPGNPVAVAVGLRFFVAPAIRLLTGLPAEQLLAARTEVPIGKRAGLMFFGKAHARLDETGQLTVSLLPGQESFRIQPLLRANCWAVISEGLEQVPAGAVIKVAPLYPTSFLQAPAVEADC